MADQRRMQAARNYRAWQMALVRPVLGRHVVEVGCGIGNFTRLLLEAPGVERVLAFDREPACVAELDALGGDRRLRALVRDAVPETFAELAGERPDTCVCLNVLEHLDDDAAALTAMVAMLAPGGAVALQVPAHARLYGTLDRRLGHRRRYARRGLRALAAAAGASVERLEYMNAAGALGWWFNARVARRARQSAAQIAVFDRLLAPAARRLETHWRPWWGQSLFAVLRAGGRR